MPVKALRFTAVTKLEWRQYFSKALNTEGRESPCSDAEVSADRVSWLFGATTSDVLETPVPIELDVVLLLWRKSNNDQLKKKTCFTIKKPTKSGEGWIFETQRYMIT